MTSKWTAGCPILYSLPPTAPRWLVPYSVQGASIRCVTRKITSAEVRVERFGRRRNPFGYLREGGQVVGGGVPDFALPNSHPRTRTRGPLALTDLREQTPRAAPQHPAVDARGRRSEGPGRSEARPSLALDTRLRSADGDGTEAELGAGSARLRRGHLDTRRRGNGARAGGRPSGSSSGGRAATPQRKRPPAR